MTKLISIAAAGLLALAATAPAFAECGINHTADISKPAPDSSTPKPKVGS